MKPASLAHERVADSKPESSLLSFWPASTSLGDAVNVSPGPPVSRATRWVTESSPAQPAGPALSVIAHSSPGRARSTAPFSAACMMEATNACLSVFSVRM